MRSRLYSFRFDCRRILAILSEKEEERGRERKSRERLSISGNERKRKIIAPRAVAALTVLSGLFISRRSARTPRQSRRSVYTPMNPPRSGLIALEASLRRVFFPNFVTAARAPLFARACLCIRYIGLRAGAPRRGSLPDF